MLWCYMLNNLPPSLAARLWAKNGREGGGKNFFLFDNFKVGLTIWLAIVDDGGVSEWLHKCYSFCFVAYF